MKGKRINTLAILIALSAVGAFIKIPSFIGSVALDSFPSLIAGAMLGGISGGIVASLGHLVSAIVGGLPLGPLHFFIAIEMFLLVLLFSIVYRSGKKIFATILFVLCNSLLLPLPFLFFMGIDFYYAIIPSLFISSLCNGMIGLIIIPRIQGIFKWKGTTR